MGKYSCKVSKRGSFSHSGLTQHTNKLHKILSQKLFKEKLEIQESRRSLQEEDLWKTSIFLRPQNSAKFFVEMPKKIINVEEVEMDEENAIEIDSSLLAIKNPSYNLRSSSIIKTSLKTTEDNISDISELSSANLDDIEIDPEDLQDATFENAIKSKNKPEKTINWPNNMYCDFMELIIDRNISNKVGDQIIKFFNIHSNLENSPLPKSTKSEKDYSNQIKLP